MGCPLKKKTIILKDNISPQYLPAKQQNGKY